jgi:hypothetical protein
MVCTRMFNEILERYLYIWTSLYWDFAVLEGYSDSNRISDVDEIKATSGYIFTIGGAAVSWRSRKQTILAKSTMEAELVALSHPLLMQSG